MILRLIKYQNDFNQLSPSEVAGFNQLLDTDVAIKKEIKALAEYYLRMQLDSCGWCYAEAHIKLIKLNIEEMKNRTNEYELRAGTVLHDPINRDFSLILTAANITERLALYHLACNPKALEYFTKTPIDLDKRLADFIADKDNGITTTLAEQGEQMVSVLELELEQAKARKEAAEKEQAEADKAIEQAEAKLAALNVLPAKEAEEPKETPNAGGKADTTPETQKTDDAPKGQKGGAKTTPKPQKGKAKK